MESGTLGTKCNVQIVLPKLTQSYGESADPAETSIPMCTLKNFPHEIEHCIEQMRDAFNGFFTDSPADTNSFIKNPKGWLSKLHAVGTSYVQKEKC